jgi:2-oxoglutarate dehydrogenase E1 component
MGTGRGESFQNPLSLNKTDKQPLNNGAWTYVQPRLITALKETQNHKEKVPIYAGRKPSSSVATGSKNAHKAEIAMINEMAFGDQAA